MQEISSIVESIDVNNNSIKARVNTIDTGYMCASILNDEGWKVFVDGKEVDKKTAFGGMIAFPITSGYHEIVLEFIPRGLRLGSVISGIAILILLFTYIKRKRDISIALTERFL